MARFQRFYLDTALSWSSAALPSVKAFARDGRSLFGADFRSAPADIAASFHLQVGAYGGLAADKQAINHRNVDVVPAPFTDRYVMNG